jgi:hypothetical protein
MLSEGGAEPLSHERENDFAVQRLGAAGDDAFSASIANQEILRRAIYKGPYIPRSH